VTAVDPSPRPLPEIGQTRYACDVRTGWHVELPGTGWALVLGVGVAGPGNGDVQITVRQGIREERTEQMARHTPLPSRIPAEQMAYIEALRLAQPIERGGGPVARLHFDQQLFARVAEILEEEES